MLMASLSHEIRTPLNGVIGTTSLLASSELSPDQVEMIQTIKVSGETLLQIINDLLDLAKMESGKFELEKKPFR
jgi:signal transduction histidine kinase